MKHLKHALWALLIPLALSACSSVTPNAPATLETQATTLTVTSTLDSGTGSLREAITNAAAGDTITFDANVKTITLSTGLVIDKDLTIAGPEGSSVTISRNNTRSFFSVLSMTSGTIELRNLTITGGSADYGGGIYNTGTLTVTNSTISDNGADYGGGIYNTGTLTVTVTNSTVSGNSAYRGGGIYNYGETYYKEATLTVTNSTVSGNNASGNSTSTINGTPDGGGGIYNEAATLTVTNSTVSGNGSTYYGGGIVSVTGTLTVTNSTVSGNGADYGGGIFSGYDAALTVTNSIVALNTAFYLDYAGLYAGQGPDILAYGVVFGNNNIVIVGENPDEELVKNGTNIIGVNPGLNLRTASLN